MSYYPITNGVVSDRITGVGNIYLDNDNCVTLSIRYVRVTDHDSSTRLEIMTRYMDIAYAQGDTIIIIKVDISNACNSVRHHPISNRIVTQLEVQFLI